MKRRSFVKGTTSALTGIALSTISCKDKKSNKIQQPFEVYVTMDHEKVSFYSEIIKEAIKIVHIADTHLYMDDDRGIPFKNYSKNESQAHPYLD